MILPTVECSEVATPQGVVCVHPLTVQDVENGVARGDVLAELLRLSFGGES